MRRQFKLECVTNVRPPICSRASLSMKGLCETSARIHTSTQIRQLSISRTSHWRHTKIVAVAGLPTSLPLVPLPTQLQCQQIRKERSSCGHLSFPQCTRRTHCRHRCLHQSEVLQDSHVADGGWSTVQPTSPPRDQH